MAPKASTTLDTFPKDLRTLLRAAAALKDVMVELGPPLQGKYEAEEWIALLDARFVQAPKAMSAANRPREERFRQEVLITVVKSGSEWEPAHDRAWALFRALEAAIRTNPTMQGYWTSTGQLVSVQVKGEGQLTKRHSGEQLEVAIRFELWVHTRI